MDVGGFLGFCTEGIVQYVDAEHVSILDQSPNQMTKVKSKSSLNGVTFIEGDAENLPFQSGCFDLATSAGSIEYCPEPQQGIMEAYGVLKLGGYATMISPIRATNAIICTWAQIHDHQLLLPHHIFFAVHGPLDSVIN